MILNGLKVHIIYKLPGDEGEYFFQSLIYSVNVAYVATLFQDQVHPGFESY